MALHVLVLSVQNADPFWQLMGLKTQPVLCVEVTAAGALFQTKS